MVQKTLKTSDNQTLYYETRYQEKNKPTLFFLHGIGGDLEAWQFIIPSLNELGYATIAMDIRGNGYSSHPKSPQAYTLERLAKDVAEIKKTENLDKFILIGHCFGSSIALEYATLYKNTLLGLIIMSSSYKPPFYITGKTTQKIANFLIDNLSKISPPPYKPHHSYYKPDKHHRDYEITGLLKTLLHNSLRSYLLEGRAAVNLNLKASLPNLSVPTLVVVGEKDHIFPKKNSIKIHELIKNSKLEIIPNTNHVLPMNNPKEVAKLISDFLE